MRSFCEIDWEFELKYLDALDSFDRFKDTLVTQVLNHVPMLSNKADDKPPWSRNPPRSLLNQQHEAWIAYIREPGRFVAGHLLWLVMPFLIFWL